MVETSLNMSVGDQRHIREGPHHIHPSNKENQFKLAASMCFNVSLSNVTKTFKIGLSSGKGQREVVTMTVHAPEEESTHIDKVDNTNHTSCIFSHPVLIHCIVLYPRHPVVMAISVS